MLRPTTMISWLAALVFASSAQGQALLDQPPTQTFSLLGSAGTATNADNFLVPGAGGATLSGMTLWGTWTPSGASNTDTFDVLVHDNVPGPFGDEPGAVLASFSGLSPTIVATGINMPTASGPLPEYELSIELPSSVDLAAGTYWVEIFSTDSAGSGDTFAWEMANQDFVFGLPCVSWSTSTPGVSWNSCTPFPESDMALRLESVVAKSYCTAKINSLGCTPAIAFAGSPSMTSASPFDISADMVINNKAGIFFYGNAAAAIPFQGGFLCVQPPTRRTAVQASGGNPPPNDCSGRFLIDFNAYAQSGIDPSITVGSNLFGQYWSRDPQSPSTTNLSNGLEWTMGN